MSDWIKCADRMPESGQRIIGRCFDGSVILGTYVPTGPARPGTDRLDDEQIECWTPVSDEAWREIMARAPS